MDAKSLNGVKKIVGKIRNSQAFWILITGFHRMIHYLLVFFTVEGAKPPGLMPDPQSLGGQRE